MGFFVGGALISGLCVLACLFIVSHYDFPPFCFSNESFDGCYISPICDSLRRSVRIQQSSV